MVWIMLLMTLILSYANGANDVSKSIATLVGAGATNYRRGILWGTIWTGIGAVVAQFFATEMVKTFTSWVKPGITVGTLFPISVAIGAMLWVFLAERLSLPVSTTHSLVGAVCGVAMFAYGINSVTWASLTGKIFVPLLTSPLIGLVLAFIIMPVVKWVVGQRVETVQLAATGTDSPRGSVAVHASGAAATPTPRQVIANRLHWLSSGLIAFSRALNDTPKLVALPILFFTLMPETEMSNGLLFVLLAVAMFLGSLLNGLRVTRTMAEKITRMTDEEGLAANISSALLVTVAAKLGLPVSTTHVANGAIVGVGLSQGGASRVSWKTVRDFLMAWVITLPTSAALGIAAYAVGHLFVR